MIYFDHNATSLLHPVARDAWLAASAEFVGNPSSPHRLGSRADRALDGAREKLSTILGCRAHELIWTSGATESNNMVIRHFAADENHQGEIWVSSIEHPSVLGPARQFLKREPVMIPVTLSGVIDLAWVESRLKKTRPSVMVVMAANNETGVLQLWREMQQLCREKEIPFFCDAVQWVGKLPARGLGSCDFVSGCAHKFGGPRGIGFLKCPSGIRPMIFGGQQENGLRAGTENVAGILSMIAMLEFREAAMAYGEINERIALQQGFEKNLMKFLPDARIIGHDSERLWNTVSAVLPAVEKRRWVIHLDKLGFAVSTGSACASGREEPSHVLAAMDISADESSRVVRFSSGWETTAHDWDSLTQAIADAL